jgi:hypothetical protein
MQEERITFGQTTVKCVDFVPKMANLLQPPYFHQREEDLMLPELEFQRSWAVYEGME